MGDSEMGDQSVYFPLSNHRDKHIHGCKYFVWRGVLEQIPMLVEFRRKLSWALIDNQWISSGARMDDEEEYTRPNEHGRVTAPPHAKTYRNRQWVCNAVSKYQQYVCRVERCKKQLL